MTVHVAFSGWGCGCQSLIGDRSRNLNKLIAISLVLHKSNSGQSEICIRTWAPKVTIDSFWRKKMNLKSNGTVTYSIGSVYDGMFLGRR